MSNTVTDLETKARKQYRAIFKDPAVAWRGHRPTAAGEHSYTIRMLGEERARMTDYLHRADVAQVAEDLDDRINQLLSEAP